ncbi:MAG TPA: DUF3047 domain-containing protein [Pelomicrobium sp.]|nr:DUF3047 domain-containing protein [Pelomicrobium sp.]
MTIGNFSAAPAGAGHPTDWEPLTFDNIARHTDYRLVQNAGTTVVRAQAADSASGLIRRIRIDPREYPVIEWRWNALDLPQGNDPRTKAGDDFAARIYVAFEYDAARAGALDRLTYEAARLIYGDYPPAGSLNYVWDSSLPEGTRFASPYTERNRVIVVESGSARLGEWVSERRNVLEDYRNAFGKEPPMIEGVAIMTDADNTGGRTAALYGDIVFRRLAD